MIDRWLCGTSLNALALINVIKHKTLPLNTNCSHAESRRICLTMAWVKEFRLVD